MLEIELTWRGAKLKLHADCFRDVASLLVGIAIIFAIFSTSVALALAGRAQSATPEAIGAFAEIVRAAEPARAPQPGPIEVGP
jgi:hypothetical protein